MEDLLLELLRCSLWGNKPSVQSLSNDECEKLLPLASEQAVSGQVGSALIYNKIKLEKEYRDEVLLNLLKIDEDNANLNAAMTSFVDMLDKFGIEYVIVKGQVLATMYPNPMTRMSGDIDLYFRGEHFDRIKKLAEKNLKTSLNKDIDRKHVEFDVNGVTFELHSSLAQFVWKRNQRYWDEIIDQSMLQGLATVSVNGKKINTLLGTYNALYVFVHLFAHMTSSGLGLRQLCDWVILLHYCHQTEDEAWKIDKIVLKKHLEALGLYKAYKAVGAMIIDKLGLPEEEFPFEITKKDRRWVKKITHNVMEAGNFGRSRRHVSETGLLHSLESGWLSMRQAMAFFPLAPKEILGRVPDLTGWFFKKLTMKHAS